MNKLNDEIQNSESAMERMVEQLRARKVDSGQYFGGQSTAVAWAVLSDEHPMKEFAGLPLDGEGKVTVVDLGPGSGKPCVAAIEPFKDRVDSIVCVDTSASMAQLAAHHIRTETSKEVRCVVADFFQDAAQLRVTLNSTPGQKVFLCLGGTAGNFRQQFALSALCFLLAVGDRLLLGLGLYDETDPERELRALGTFFASETNCRFGLRFLKACGGKVDYQQAYSRYEDDPEEEGVKVVRGFYRFSEDTTLHVAERSVVFRRDDVLQFVESRRYPKNATEHYLRKYGLDVIASEDFGRHGLYLCKPGKGDVVESQSRTSV